MLAINDYGEDEDYLGQVVDDYENDDNIASMINAIHNETLNCMELNLTAPEKVYENFSSWTEFEEAGDRITFVSDYQIHVGFSRAVDSRIYKDFGVSYFNVFDDYELDLMFDSTTWGVNGKVFILFSNYTDNTYAQHLAGRKFLVITMSRDSGPINKMYVQERDSGLSNSVMSTTNFVFDTWYYTKIILNSTTFSLEVYSDVDKTVLVEEIAVTLIYGKDDYRYAMISSLDTGHTIEADAYLKNYYLGGMSAGYEAAGTYYVDNVLDGDPAIAILYNLTIPTGGGATMEFSTDNMTWVDHNNQAGSDTLVAGYETLDLRDIYNGTIYRRVNMTRNGVDTPRMWQARFVTVTDVDCAENVTGAWVDYNVTSIVTVVGDNVTGFLNSTYFKDGDFYSVTEVTGGPGYDIRFNVTGLPENLICLCLDLFMYYDGSGGHTFQIEVWNFTDSNWDFVEDIPDECCRWFNNTLECIPGDYVQNGTLMGRFYHPSPGNVNHVWGIDYGKLRVYAPYEEVPAVLAMGRYYALAIILLILGILLGLGMRGKR